MAVHPPRPTTGDSALSVRLMPDESLAGAIFFKPSREFTAKRAERASTASRERKVAEWLENQHGQETAGSPNHSARTSSLSYQSKEGGSMQSSQPTIEARLRNVVSDPSIRRTSTFDSLFAYPKPARLKPEESLSPSLASGVLSNQTGSIPRKADAWMAYPDLRPRKSVLRNTKSTFNSDDRYSYVVLGDDGPVESSHSHSLRRKRSKGLLGVLESSDPPGSPLTSNCTSSTHDLSAPQCETSDALSTSRASRLFRNLSGRRPRKNTFDSKSAADEPPPQPARLLRKSADFGTRSRRFHFLGDPLKIPADPSNPFKQPPLAGVDSRSSTVPSVPPLPSFLRRTPTEPTSYVIPPYRKPLLHIPRPALPDLLKSASEKRRKLVISGVALDDTTAEENIRKWCTALGSVRKIQRMPDGVIHVHFGTDEAADAVCKFLGTNVTIKGVGTVGLGWYRGRGRTY